MKSPPSALRNSPTKDTELKALRKKIEVLQKKLEDATSQTEQLTVVRVEKEQQDAVREAVSKASKLLEKKHTIELKEIREEEARRLERARAEATKHAAAPHVKALAAEVEKREALEAELAEARAAGADAVAAREAEGKAREQVIDANDARTFMEGYVTQQILRAKEFVGTNEERVEMVRRYAESLEAALAKVDEEKDAVQARAQEVASQEIVAIKLERAIESAIQSRDTSEAIENAMAEKRKTELEVLKTQVDLKGDVAAAIAKTAAAEKAQNDVLLMIEPSKNDASMKKIAELRLRAMTLDVESATLEFATKAEAAAASSTALQESNDVRFHAEENVINALNPEVEAYVQFSKASASSTHATSVAQEYVARVRAAEMEAARVEIEANADATSAIALAKLEYTKEESTATLEASDAEGIARATSQQTIAEATLDSEKKTRSTRDEQVASEAAANAEADSVRKTDAEVSKKQQTEAKIDEATRTVEAHKDWSNTMLKAAADEMKAQMEETEAVAAVVIAAKGWQKVSAETKATAARKNNAEVKEAAEEARAEATATFDRVAAQITKDTERKVVQAQTTLGKATAGTAARLTATMTAMGQKYDALLKDIEQKAKVAILEATTTRESTLAEVKSIKKRAIDAAQSKREATLAMIEETRTSKIAAAVAKREAAIAEAARVAAANGGHGSNEQELKAAEATAKQVLEAAEAKVKAAELARKAAVFAADAAKADAAITLAAAQEASAARVKEAEAKREKSKQQVEETRSKANAQAADVKVGEGGTIDKSRKSIVASIEAEAKKARDETEAAKAALAKAEASHANARAKAATALEKEIKTIEATRAEAAEQMEAAKAEQRRVRALEEAAAEAEVARKEANVRRARAEADRRKAEEARMTAQHESIGRRPGGRLFFERLRAAHS